MPPLQGVAKGPLSLSRILFLLKPDSTFGKLTLGDITFPYTVSMKMATQFWRCRSAHGTEIDGVIHALSAGG
jgi:hypothetical protein